MRKIGFGCEGLAEWATIAMQSRGRFYPEEDSPTRTHFQRDRDRVIHSTSFRRLNHKTQVFVYHEGDHYRTRLIHSIEVAQIARTLACALRVDEDLAEALALAHDFGHTPFGHAGEEVLNEMMQDFGGFDHNAQALKLVTGLERQYAQFDGLNLSWECLEGLVKHNGPLKSMKDIHYSIMEFNELYDLELDRYSAIEAQCAAIADNIAYNAHDLDDGLRAGLFDPDALKDIPLIGEILGQVRKLYPGLDNRRLAHEIVRRQITFMVEDVIDQAMSRIETIAPASANDVRDAGEAIVTFSEQAASYETAIKAFLSENMYQSPKVVIMRDNAKTIIRDLFSTYFSDNVKMPDEWGAHWLEASGKTEEKKRARLVSDFLSGMTDKFAIAEHRRLFDVTPDLS